MSGPPVDGSACPPRPLHLIVWNVWLLRPGGSTFRSPLGSTHKLIENKCVFLMMMNAWWGMVPVLEEMGLQKLPEVAELLTVLIICTYPWELSLPQWACWALASLAILQVAPVLEPKQPVWPSEINQLKCPLWSCFRLFLTVAVFDRRRSESKFLFNHCRTHACIKCSKHQESLRSGSGVVFNSPFSCFPLKQIRLEHDKWGKCFPPACPGLSAETQNPPLLTVSNIVEHFPLWCWTTGLKCAPHSPLLLCESNWSSWNGAGGFAGVWTCSHSVRKANPIRVLCFSFFYEISHFLAIAVCL